MNNYTVEIYKENGNHVKQAGIFATYESAEKFTDDNTLEDGYFFSIWCIEYDSNGNESASFPVY